MSNEIVKYDPELNTIPLRKFTPVEMNLFFSIVSRMRDETVRISFDQLKELIAYKPTANNRFIDDIESTYQKILEGVVKMGCIVNFLLCLPNLR